LEIYSIYHKIQKIITFEWLLNIFILFDDIIDNFFEDAQNFIILSTNFINAFLCKGSDFLLKTLFNVLTYFWKVLCNFFFENFLSSIQFFEFFLTFILFLTYSIKFSFFIKFKARIQCLQIFFQIKFFDIQGINSNFQSTSSIKNFVKTFLYFLAFSMKSVHWK